MATPTQRLAQALTPTPSVDRGGVTFAPGKIKSALAGGIEGLMDLFGEDDAIDKVQAEAKRRKELVESPDTTFLGRAAKGAEDIVTGIVDIAGAAIPVTERRPGETEEQAEQRAAEYSRKLFKSAAEGAVVQPATTFAALIPGTGVPLETLAADPVGTTLDVLPVATGVGRVAKAKAAGVPGVARAIEAVKESPVARAVKESAAGQKVAKAAQGVTDAYTAALIDNLMGTEVPELPALVRQMERQAAELAEFPTPDVKATPQVLRQEYLQMERPQQPIPTPARRPGKTPPARVESPFEVSPADIEQVAKQSELLAQLGSEAPSTSLMVPSIRRKMAQEIRSAGRKPDQPESMSVTEMDAALRQIPPEREVFYGDVQGEVAALEPLTPAERAEAVPSTTATLVKQGLEGISRRELRAVDAALEAIKEGQDVELPRPRLLTPSDWQAMVDLSESGLLLPPFADDGGKALAKARELADELAAYETVQYGGKELKAPPRVAKALAIEQAAKEGLSGSIPGEIMQAMKSGVTSRSVKSSINNLMGNVVLQSIRRAGDRGYKGLPRPTEMPKAREVAPAFVTPTAGALLGPVGSEMAQWSNAYLQRKWAKDNAQALPDDYVTQKWTALDKERIYDTNQYDVELKPGGLAAIAGKYGMERTAAGLKGADEFLGKVYKSGDTLAKGAEASRTYDSVVRLLDRQPVGEQYVTELRGRDGVKAKVSKISDDPTSPAVYKVEANGRTTTITEGTPQWARLVAGVAAEQADRVFFDYNRTSGLAKRLRAMPILGIGSPFYSWLSLALDLPGKKGLLSSAVTGPDFVTGKNWWGAADIADNTARVAARAALHGAVINQLASDTGDEVLGMIQRYPKQFRNRIVTDLSNPKYAEVARFGNWNSFEPSTLVMAAADMLTNRAEVAAQGGELAVMQRKDLPARKMAALLRKQQLAQGFTGEDFLNLVGLGGSMALDAIQTVDKDAQPGESIDAAKLFIAAAKSLAGTTLVDIAGVATESASREFGGLPGGPYGPKPQIDPQLEEGWLQYIIRQFTGVGWETLAANPDKKHWNAVERAWKGSLGLDDAKRNLKNLAGRRDLTAEQRKAMQDEAMRIRRWESIIETELRRMQANLYRAKLMAKTGKRVPAEVPPAKKAETPQEMIDRAADDDDEED